MLTTLITGKWIGADLQKQTATDLIYSGLYVVQNQYQDSI